MATKMNRQYFRIESKVRISEESEHFPGETVWVIDSADDDDEYPYFVGPTKLSLRVDQGQWVKAEHMSPVAKPKRERKSLLDNPILPIKESGDPLEVGDYVIAEDIKYGALARQEGFVTEIESNRIGIAPSKGLPAVSFIKREYIRHCEQ